jgi:hypothetical protein
LQRIRQDTTTAENAKTIEPAPCRCRATAVDEAEPSGDIYRPVWRGLRPLSNFVRSVTAREARALYLFDPDVHKRWDERILRGF